jgi:hypothetical protein
VHGGDDLFGVDALQIDAGGAEVGVLDMRVIWQPGLGYLLAPRIRVVSGYAVGAKRRSA